MRAVIADDNLLIRAGITALLREAGIEVAAEAASDEELLAAVDAHEPDVAIVDIRMPPTHTDEGLRAAQEIRETHPGVGVLVLSQYVEPGYAMALLESSAEGVGYLLKDRVADLDQFGTSVRRVADGGSALDPAVVSELVGRKRRDDPLDQLTAVSEHFQNTLKVKPDVSGAGSEFEMHRFLLQGGGDYPKQAEGLTITISRSQWVDNKAQITLEYLPKN